MALATAARRPRRGPLGHASPRIAPPCPLRTDISALRREAQALGIRLIPWQEIAARYLEALGPDDRHLYREVAVVVSRQQGKTTLAKPLIVRRLRQGRRILHLAQVRELPRTMFRSIADALSDEPDLFPKRRGRTIWPRYGSGQEEMILANGGSYRIVAASQGGARGHPADDVIIDELREMDSLEAMDAIESTVAMSPDSQIVYLSNAGTAASIVLNGVRARRDDDPDLAYLEWSAAPERAVDDRDGWLEADSAIGHFPQALPNLEAIYRRHRLSNTLPGFETENLCRWVTSMQPRLVSEADWLRSRGEPGAVRRPAMGIGVDNRRASAVIAWPIDESMVGLEVVADVELGDDTAIEQFGPDLRKLAAALRVRSAWYDPWTDADLARYLPGAKPLQGREYSQASAKFASLVETGRLRWQRADAVGADLAWTTRGRAHGAAAWQAVKADADRPITAALAAVRAVWLASGPRAAAPKVM